MIDYLIIPRWMIIDLDLNRDEIFVYSILCGFSHEDYNDFEHENKQILNYLKMDEADFCKTVNSLIDKGLVAVDEGKANYNLTPIVPDGEGHYTLKGISEEELQFKKKALEKRKANKLLESQVNYLEAIIVPDKERPFCDMERRYFTGLIRRFGIDEVIASSEIAVEKYGYYDLCSTDYRKIGGICYNRAKEMRW